MNIERILDRFKSLEGKIGFSFFDLTTEEEIFYNSHEVFEAASIIKLPMLVVMEKLFSEGVVSPLDLVTVRDMDKVGGCGALTLIPGEIVLSYQGLCNLMIALSDNTATNILLNLFSLKFFNEEFQKLGLRKTVLKRMLFDDQAQAIGLENLFCLDEMIDLLARAYRGQLISQESSRRILDTLKLQQINHKLPDKLPDELEIAHKTGEDDGITHDLGIVYGKRPYVIGFASNDTVVSKTQDVMREVSKLLYDALHEDS